MKSSTGWEHYSHDADIGVRGYGKTPEKAFEQTALAVMALITDLKEIKVKGEPIMIYCKAPDNGLLLADWLNALIFEMASRHMLFCRFEVSIKDYQLIGKAWGEALDMERHKPAVEAKGATYTTLKVEQGPDGIWVAQCVVDV